DSLEPNDSILEAKTIASGKAIKAAIMDGKDFDFYRLEADDEAKQLEVKITNLSTTLRPHIVVFDGNKSNIGSFTNKTGGADLISTAKTPPGSAVYLRIQDYYTSAGGAYEITATFKP
ncbi:MAG: hypothetical protein K0U34_05725, partial [Alphaproteobacteria bacterium]|nr:hypothetical protein [Alphaproteobacteria bacterium]